MNIFKNTENNKAFDIDPDWYKNREKGISCFFRVKNEAEFIAPSILSIIDDVDEVIVALQPSVDGTREIIESIDNNKIKILDYPFKLLPNGPGFKNQDAASVHCKAYYYNWTLSKTKYSWAIKWDGDMIALPELKKHISEPKRNCHKRFFGHDIVKISGNKMFLSGNHPISNAAPSGMFPIKPQVEYIKSDESHVFNMGQGRHVHNCYLHFKWCKKYFDDIWKQDWRNIPKFQKLCERAIPGDECKVKIPEVLRPYLKEEMGFQK